MPPRRKASARSAMNLIWPARPSRSSRDGFGSCSESPTLGFTTFLDTAQISAPERNIDELRRARDQTQARIAFLKGPPDTGAPAPPTALAPDDTAGVQDRANNLERIARTHRCSASRMRAASGSLSSMSAGSRRSRRCLLPMNNASRLGEIAGDGFQDAQMPAPLPHSLILGSSQSRRASPNRLKANTARLMATPGKMIIQGAS